MLYREIIAVCSQIDTKHINTLCGQNVEFFNVKPGGTYSDQWALKGSSTGNYALPSLTLKERHFTHSSCVSRDCHIKHHPVGVCSDELFTVS